jgi:hypothetical protein
MFEVIIDPEVIDRLTSRLDLLSMRLTHAEWAHMLALLGLGATALADTVCPTPDPPTAPAHRRIAPLGSPGFARALNPAAEALGALARDRRHVKILNRSEGSRWEVRSGPRPPANTEARPPLATAAPAISTEND